MKYGCLRLSIILLVGCLVAQSTSSRVWSYISDGISRALHPNRVYQVLPSGGRSSKFPTTNAEAVAAYTDPEFLTYDQFGNTRLAPTAESRVVSIMEQVPYHVYSRDLADAGVKLHSWSWVRQGKNRMEPVATVIVGPQLLISVQSFHENMIVYSLGIIDNGRHTNTVKTQDNLLEFAKRFVIKYMTFCDPSVDVANTQSTDDHPDGLLIEGYFLELLSGLGIASRLVYFSSAVEVRERRVNSPRLVKSRSLVCSKSSKNWFKKPKIRYSIIERMGIYLGDLPSVYFKLSSRSNRIHRLGYAVPVMKALQLGVYMFDLLRQLGDRAIALGGNFGINTFAFKSEDATIQFIGEPILDDTGNARLSENPLLLSDFTTARIIDAEEFSAQNFVSPKILVCKRFSSLWQLSGQTRLSFRDDAFRVFIVMGSMVYGPGYAEAIYEMCERAKEDENNYYLFKKQLENDNLLNTIFQDDDERSVNELDAASHQYDPNATIYYEALLVNHCGLSDEIGSDQNNLMDQILDQILYAMQIVRSTEVTEIPNYAEIIKSLLNAMSLLAEAPWRV